MFIKDVIETLLKYKKLHENFYILASFSNVTEGLLKIKDKNTKNKYLVYSIHIIPYTTLSKAAVTRLKFYNWPYINIIMIRDYFKNPEGRPLQWQYTDDSTDKNFIRIAQYTYPDFFVEELLDFFFFKSDNLDNLDRTYFLFHSSLWFIILAYFRNNNYILSQGSTKIRGVCSEVHRRTNRFLDLYQLDIVRGYHGKLLPLIKEKIDFTSEFGKEKYEEIKSLISKDFENKDKNITSLNNGNTQNNNNSNLNNNTNSTPFGINGQNRKFHTYSNRSNHQQKRSFSSSSSLLNTLTNKLNSFYMDLIKHRNKDSSVSSVSLFIKNYFGNPLYNNLRRIMNDIELDNPSKKQERIEETLTDFWRREIVALFRDNQKLFRSEYGIKMIYNNIIKLDRDLQDLKDDNRALKGKKYKLLLKLMSNPDIVSIVLSNVIPFCIKFDSILNQNVISLFEKVGKEIESVFYRNEWYKYLNRNKKEWNDKSDTVLNNHYIINIKNYEIKIVDTIENMGIIFEDKLTENEFIDKLRNIVGVLTENDYFKIGLDLIEFISAKSSLFIIDNKKVDKETLKRYILPGDALKNNLLNIITQDSDLIPMISKPEDWIIVKGKKEGKFYIKNYGGFISNKNNKNNFLKKSHKNIGLSKLHNLDLINAINYLSSIKYCINHDLLKIVFELLDKSDDRITKLVKIDLHPQTKDVFKLSTDKNKQKELYDILKHNSQYYGDRTVLQNALLFSRWCSNKKNSIYFPLFVDWRGRILTNTGSFSYQQGELSRSLILFRDGVKLNFRGLESLKVYAANCFGLDKLAYNQRLIEIDKNLDKIIKLDIDYIFEAEEPFLFLSCCLELKGYFDDPDNFISRLPIYLDATCNGLICSPILFL
jgi:hypothetical protein